MDQNRTKLNRRFVLAGIFMAFAAIGRAQTLLSDGFARPEGLITNEWAFWNPAQATAKKDSIWEMDSGSFFTQGGAGWTGLPDTATPNAGSLGGTNSAIFRLNTKRADLGNVQVSFDLMNQGLSSTAKTPAQDWDGCHVWVRYQSEYRLYYASINRRDNTSIIKKKTPGGTSNGGTYHNLTPAVPHPVPYGRWQKIKVTAEDNSDGSVTITLYADDVMIAQARDDGSVGGPPIRGGGRIGVRGDNANLKFDNFTVAALGAVVEGADTVAPSVLISAPASGIVVQGVFELKAETADNVKVVGVQYQIDGVNLGPEVTAPPFVQNWYSNTGVNGTHTVRAVARDAAGNKKISDPVTFTLAGARPAAAPTGDVVPPTVAIISPASGQALSGVVQLKVNAGDNVGVTGVQYFVDGAPMGGEVSAPYTAEWSADSAENGKHVITALAHDAAGNKTTSAPVAVTTSGGGMAGAAVAIATGADGAAATAPEVAAPAAPAPAPAAPVAKAKTPAPKPAAPKPAPSKPTSRRSSRRK